MSISNITACFEGIHNKNLLCSDYSRTDNIGVVLYCDEGDCDLSVPNASAQYGLDADSKGFVAPFGDATLLVLGFQQTVDIGGLLESDPQSLKILANRAEESDVPVLVFSAQRSGSAGAWQFNPHSAAIVHQDGSFEPQ